MTYVESASSDGGEYESYIELKMIAFEIETEKYNLQIKLYTLILGFVLAATLFLYIAGALNKLGIGPLNSDLFVQSAPSMTIIVMYLLARFLQSIVLIATDLFYIHRFDRSIKWHSVYSRNFSD